MPASAELRRYVQPLLARHDDLGFAKRLIVLRPVRHFACGVLLDGALPKDEFRPLYMVAELFAHHGRLPPMYGNALYYPRRGVNEYWSVLNPRALELLIAEVEDKALPVLRAIATLEDFYAHTSMPDEFTRQTIQYDLLRHAPVAAALGDKEVATSICRELASGKSPWTRPWLWEEARPIVEEFCPPVLAGDWSAVTALLHRWEEASVHKNKLESYWQPTPFPLELTDT
ncbi:MAG: hypothetical protein JNK84_06585 [Phreatobacter sp.]|uniref:hypothetical protein n=1 Tax=Phreatobacter sp. TaxID=1966341 RepID=UPI001A3FAEF7|nr:hypothetical protein [Phreatobacter sp.]MBL8568736.1 hypothetical protein [Phreatobacter sp.]